MKPIFLSLLLALPLMGQAPVIPGLVPPAERGEPVDAPPARAKPFVRGGTPDPDVVVIPVGQAFDQDNMTGQEAANLYHRHTGKRVIVQAAAALAEIKMFQPGPLTNGEITSLLEKQLLMEGFAFIPSGDNEVKLVLSSGPVGPTDSGPQLYGPEDELPVGDEFITYVMPLQYLKPDEALRAFQQVVGTYGPAGKVASVPNAASVVINANSALVKALVALKKKIDVPSAQVSTKFVEVTFADVEELAERLNEIFNNQQTQGRSTAGQQRTVTPGAAGIPGLTNALAGASTAGEDTPVNILPDTRTNRLFLMGRPVDLTFIEGLIKDFDSPSSQRNFLRHKMRYLPVGEFLPVAADALERTLESGSSMAGGAGGGNSRSMPSRNSNTTNNRNTGLNNSNTGGRGGGSGGGSRAQLAQQDVQTAPESMLVGKTLLVADNISNSIIVQGPPHHVEIVENLIRELDQASEQVAITAVFGRYDVTDGGSFGVDLAHILKDVSGGLELAGQTNNGTPSVIDPGTLTSIANVISAPGTGLSLYGILGNELGVFVNAVEANSNFVATNRATVFTTNNHEARISSGARIAVPTSTFTGGNVGTGQTTNVEFRDVVLELVVLPLVNDSDTVTLNISLVRDDVGEDRTIGELIVPDIITDELTTTITVKNRSTIILGGLITETDRHGKNGVPLLSSIPGIGRLFSRTTKEIERQELVMMIHPTIISDDRQLDDYQREYDSGSSVAADSRATITGTGVLPSRETVKPVYDKASGQVAQPVQEHQDEPQRVPHSVVTSPAQQARERARSSLKNRRRR